MAATQEKSLSQFPTAAQILLTTLVFGSVVDATSSSGYDSVKILVSDLAEAILGDFAYTQDLATDTKTIFGAINSIRVLSGTATPNNDDGANGQIYVKYASGTYAVVALYVKLNDAWREISTGGGGGASVQMGTTTPTAASGSDGDLYVQYDGTTYEVVAMFVKINGAWREIPLGGADYIECTQSEYDAWEQAGTLDPDVMYFITDGQSGGGATELADLTDVDITSPADGQLLRYNGTSGKWENAGIINDTTASTSSVYSSSKTNTLLSAKANSSDIPTKTSDLTNDSGFTVVTTVSWGTSITIKYIKSNFLLFISNQLFVLWFYGGGYANVDIRNTGTNDVASGAGTVTLGNITVKRTSDGFTVTTGTTNATISVIG